MSDFSAWLMQEYPKLASNQAKVQWDGYQPWATPAQATPLPTVTPSAPAAAGTSTNWGSIAGGGIEAAGQTVGMIAQIAGEQSARDQIARANDVQRQWQEKMAMEQLSQQQQMFDKGAEANAYRSLLSAFGGQVGNTYDARELQRSGTRNAADAFSTAYLGR